MSSNWYKNNETDQIWWKDTPDSVGEWLFSFDKKQVFNIFADYPHNLTPEQKKYLMKKILNGVSSSKIEYRKHGQIAVLLVYQVIQPSVYISVI